MCPKHRATGSGHSLERHPADVPAVMLFHQQFLVPRVLGVALGLERLISASAAWSMAGMSTPRAYSLYCRGAGHHVGDDQSLQVLLMA